MIQIDMDIPKTCDDCPFHVYHSGKNYVCVATPLFYPMNLANYKDGRKDFCPLIEVTQEPILDKIKTDIAKFEDTIPFVSGDIKAKYANIGQHDGLEQALEIIEGNIKGDFDIDEWMAEKE